MKNKAFEGKPAIIVKVYDRPQHLKQCLESLERCDGAEASHVIVGSDAPFKKEHANKIDLVRNYLLEKKKSHRFEKLSIISFQENVGELGNAAECHALAKLHGHDSFILMEDDVIVGRYFLDFMEKALKEYVQYPEIIAVNGYLEHDLSKVPESLFLYNRFSAYGYGSWYKKWDVVQKKRDSVNYAEKILSDFSEFRKVASLTPHAKSYPFLAERFYRAGDLEIGLMMELEGLWVVRPPMSLTANRGMDGSGLRSGVNFELQSIDASDELLDVLPMEELQRRKLQDVKPRLDLKNVILNWFIYGVYRYLPLGFPLLIKLRSFKKSL